MKLLKKYMKKNPYFGKFTPHLSRNKQIISQKKWFFSMGGKPILQKKKDAGFIVFEGLDGSGQTTQVNLLKEFLVKKGLEVISTKEPTMDSGAGKKIRKVLDKELTIPAEKFQGLFAKDRAKHIKQIIVPGLKFGKVVISDRYLFSSLAYGTADGLDLDYLISLNKKFLELDLTIFLKTSPRVCVERIKKRGEKITLFEKEKRLEKVWKIYEKLSKRFGNIVVLDGEKSIKEIQENIKKISTKRLNLK